MPILESITAVNVTTARGMTASCISFKEMETLAASHNPGTEPVAIWAAR